MTNVGPSSLKQLTAAAAGQSGHLDSLASAMGDKLQIASCYKNMYVEWRTALSQAAQGPLDLTMLMQEVTQAVCSKPLTEGEILLGKDEALLEVTGDGNRLNLENREVCVATEDEFPISRVDQLYRRTVESLNPHFDTHFAPAESRLITVQHLSKLQQLVLKPLENEALETIWKQGLAAQFNQENNPNLQTHEQIRAWFNKPNNAPLLQQITSLNLNAVGLKALPPEIGMLSNLRELLVCNNQLRSLPSEISALSNLGRFYLTNNEFFSLPPEIGALSNLQELHLSNNLLRFLPPEIGLLSNLRELYASTNQLRSLPPEIGALSNLRWLEICKNQLHSLPPEIGALINLLELDLFDNQLGSLPSEIRALSSLQRLVLSNNQLLSIPPEIGALSNLGALYLYNNQLRSLPPEIGALGALQHLSVLHNQLRSLPSEIGALTSLTELNLQSNQLRSLPSEITALTNLRMLSLCNNQLCSLPSQITALKNIELFQRDGNPWIFISDEDLAKNPSVATFFKLNKKFIEYPTQSSLGHLFQLIARNEEASTIQNTFEELDEKLQSRIKELANAEVLVPVAASSNWTPSTDENLFADTPRLSRAVKQATYEKFEALSPEQKSSVYLKILELAGRPEAQDPVKWGVSHAFDNMLRFVDALESVTKK